MCQQISKYSIIICDGMQSYQGLVFQNLQTTFIHLIAFDYDNNPMYELDLISISLTL